MNPRLYLETTIPSYLVSKPSRDLVTAAHQQITHHWWETRLADFEVYISQFVIDEAGAGDADMAARRLEAIAGFPVLDATPEALGLARALIERGVIPPRKATDAAHHCHRNRASRAVLDDVELRPSCECGDYGAGPGDLCGLGLCCAHRVYT